MSEQDTHTSAAATGMENELVSQVDAPYLTGDQHEEKTNQSTKASTHHSSKRRSSPSSHHRNYRKRSPSESPERSPSERRSPENSPSNSSRRRSRNSDYRDDRRHRRRSRSRSRSRSPRRRRRSPSPRNSTNERGSGRHFDEFGRDLPPEPLRGSSEEKDKAGAHKDGEEQSPLCKKSPSERRGADVERSPDRHGTVSPDKADRDRSSPKKSLERESQSPKRKDLNEKRSKSPDKRRRSKSPDKRRRSKSPDKRRRRSRSQSPERRRKKDYRRSPDRDSRDRRASSDYNSSRHWDRNSNRDRNRGRDSRDRDWDRERRYYRGYDRDRNREQGRDREQDRHDDQAISPTQDKKMFVKASSTGLKETLPRPARALTSEEVQAKLAAHAESLRKQAQDAASVLNLPSYINPSVVNPHQYAVQQQKRKLLWSGKKAEAAESGSGSSSAKSTKWNTTTFCNDQGGEMQAKFRRLMGIKGDGNTTAQQEGAQQEGAQPQNDQLMANLEKEFERSRAFQLSRGAGGKSGIGLGYSGT